MTLSRVRVLGIRAERTAAHREGAACGRVIRSYCGPAGSPYEILDRWKHDRGLFHTEDEITLLWASRTIPTTKSGASALARNVPLPLWR